MFLIRQTKPDDVHTLVRLARMVYFINLPPSESIIRDKVAVSASSFVKAAGGKPSTTPSRRGKKGVTGLAEHTGDLFMFSIEDLDGGGVVGTSQIRAHMGGAGNPNWRMKLTERKFFAPELGQGTTHTVAQLDGDESGPTEIGGLIIQPSHRGHKLRPGRFLSFVRFHFIALHRALFADTILAEMMGPVTSDGDNIFWDAFGRKFIPVKYAEADRFCQHNRKFISELLPKEEVYITLFPLEIQNVVGTVSKETVPARRLLESLGFKYRGYIDPFDAGPHLDAPTGDIELVRATRRLSIGKPIAEDKCEGHGIVSILTDKGEFRAVEGACSVTGGTIRLPERAMAALQAEPGAQAGFTPLDPAAAEAAGESSSKKRAPRRAPSDRKKVRA